MPGPVVQAEQASDLGRDHELVLEDDRAALRRRVARRDPSRRRCGVEESDAELPRAVDDGFRLTGGDRSEETCERGGSEPEAAQVVAQERRDVWSVTAPSSGMSSVWAQVLWSQDSLLAM